MEYGIFSTAFGQYSIEEIAAKLAAAGMRYTQFYPQLEGKWLMPEDFTDEVLRRINRAFSANGVTIVAVGAGNRFVSANESEAAAALKKARQWIEIASKIGARIAVTETGTAHKTEFWTDVPENHTEKTWGKACSVYRELAAHGQRFGITVGIEPHFASVVRDAGELRKIVDDVNEPNLKVVLDPANSVTPENSGSQEKELENLFALVGKDFVLAHAKDARIEDGKSLFGPAGSGVLPYGKYLALLRDSGYMGPLLLEYVGEDFSEPLAYVRGSGVPPFLRPLAAGDPLLYDLIQKVQDSHHGSGGAIPLKYRLLLSAVADALVLHPAGAGACAREAAAAGATQEELREAMRVVYAAGGLPTLVESIDVYKEIIAKK